MFAVAVDVAVAAAAAVVVVVVAFVAVAAAAAAAAGGDDVVVCNLSALTRSAPPCCWTGSADFTSTAMNGVILRTAEHALCDRAAEGTQTQIGRRRP